MVVVLMIINPLLTFIKSIQIVVMVIKSFAVILINTQNQYNATEVKMLFINSWKQCYNELSSAVKQEKIILINHQK